MSVEHVPKIVVYDRRHGVHSRACVDLLAALSTRRPIARYRLSNSPQVTGSLLVCG
jgi:hypothetical protein